MLMTAALWLPVGFLAVVVVASIVLAWDRTGGAR